MKVQKSSDVLADGHPGVLYYGGVMSESLFT